MSQKKTNKTVAKQKIPQRKAPAETQRKNAFYLAIITVLVLVLYLPALNYDFTHNDDLALIKDNYEFLSKTSSIPDIFTQSVFYNTFKVTDTYYRPILTLSYFIDTQIAGKNYWFFYLTDILLHLGCCLMLYFILIKLSQKRLQSFLLTALFAVHPALVQAIAWLPGRNDTLLSLFALVSFSSLIEYCGSKNLKHLAVHIFFLLTACFTKESAIFLPLLFLLYLLMWRSEKVKLSRGFSENWMLITLWVITIIITFVVRKSVLDNAVGMPLSYTISNFITNLPAIVQYIGKILIPANLSTMPVLEDVPIYYGIAVILIVSFFIWKSKTKNVRHVFFGLLWLLIFLAPSILRTSQFIETLFLEHRLYFPMIGFILIAGETDLIRKFNAQRVQSWAIYSAVGLMFFITAWFHREDYSDQYHYWKSAVDGSPHSSAAMRGMAAYYMDVADKTKNITEAEKEKYISEAENLYIKCLEINPDIPEVRNNLGRIYFDRDDTIASKKLFLEEIDLNPRSAMAFYNLGHIYFSQNNYTSAEAMMRKSYTIDSTDAVVKADLATCLALLGRYEESFSLCVSLLEKYKDYEPPKNCLRYIFANWTDEEKVLANKKILDQKGILY